MFRKLLALLSDTMIYGLSGSLSRLVGLLLLPFLTDYLSPADFGVVFMLSIVGMLFVPLANLGMTNALFRRFNQSTDPAARALVLCTGLSSVACSTLTVLAVSLLLAGPISQVMVGDESSTSLVQLTLLGAASASIAAVFSVALRAARRVKTAAAMNVTKVVVSACATLTLVIGADMGVRGVVLGGLLAELVTAIAQLAFTLKEFRAKVDWQLWKGMLAYGLPFTPHQLQTVGLELFGVYMVRQMLGLEAAGLYGIAARFASPVSLVVGSIQTSWVPYKFHIQAEDADPKKFFQSVFVYYVAGLSYLWVGVSLWGPEVVRLMTAPNFHSAAWIVWATTLVPTAQGLYFMSSAGFELGNNTRSAPLVSLLGLITVVGAAFVLIGPLGALGAALSTSLGWLVMAVTIYFLSQRQFPIAYDWPTIGVFVVLAALFVVIGYGVQTAPIAARLPIFILLSLLYPVFGFILLLLRSRDEKARMRILLSKLRLVSLNR
jgi:O-antigen/teichoic acid export membrane protein